MRKTLALLAILALTGCATRNPKPSPFQGPTETIDAAGNRVSYAGRTSAAAGQLTDTAEAQIVVALADKIKPGTPFTYTHSVNSDVEQPNVDLESKVETEQKAAASDAAKALAAGAKGDYLAAASKVADLGGKLLDIRAAKNAAPKSDSRARSVRQLAVGPESGGTAVQSIQTYGDAYKSKSRASFAGASESKTTDTTAPADWEALAKILEALKKPILPPAAIPVEPPIVFPPIDPAPVSTNTTETIRLPELPK